jgi:hypothetical protein
MGKEKTPTNKFVKDYKQGYKKINRFRILLYTSYVIAVAIIIIIAFVLYRAGISR